MGLSMGLLVLVFLSFLVLVFLVGVVDWLVNIDLVEVVFVEMLLLEMEVVEMDLVQMVLMDDMLMVVVLVDHLLVLVVLMNNFLRLVLMGLEMLDGVGWDLLVGVGVILLDNGRGMGVGVFSPDDLNGCVPSTATMANSWCTIANWWSIA